MKANEQQVFRGAVTMLRVVIQTSNQSLRMKSEGWIIQIKATEQHTLMVLFITKY